MSKLSLCGRPVCDLDWEGKGVDSFFVSGHFDDAAGGELTDTDLETLTESDAGQTFLVEANYERFGYYQK